MIVKANYLQQGEADGATPNSNSKVAEGKDHI
jgi:hypothetical protein